MDPTTFIWRQGPSLPYPVRGHCAARTTDGRLIVAGGWSVRAVRSKMRNVLELDEDDGETWRQLPSMAEGRATHACAASRYEVIGGQENNLMY